MSITSAARTLSVRTLLRTRRRAVLGAALTASLALLSVPGPWRAPITQVAAVTHHLPFVVDRLQPAEIAGPGAAVPVLDDHAAETALIAALPREDRRQTAPDLPIVGSTISPATRTCARGTRAGTPTTSAACAAWVTSGPVNVVIMGLDGVDPASVLWAAGSWRPADGHWLIANALMGPGSGCSPGWRDSQAQFELRLDRARRHHIKLITDSCNGRFGAYTVAFGDAHTDLFQLKGCGGDHAVDWDTARDQVVAALRKSRAVAAVVYVQTWRPSTSFAGGCRTQISTDGRVAYIVLDAPTPAGPRSHF